MRAMIALRGAYRHFANGSLLSHAILLAALWRLLGHGGRACGLPIPNTNVTLLKGAHPTCTRVKTGNAATTVKFR